MKPITIVIFVVACSGGSTGPTTPTNKGSGSAPAATGPVYAKLFENGAKWTFTAQLKKSPPAEDGPATTEPRPDVACVVDHVHEMGSAKMSYITCTGSDAMTNGEQPPAGLWVATDAGLWWFTVAEEKQAHQLMMGGLDAKKQLIATPPKARNDEIKDAQEGLHIYNVAQKGDAWCAGYTSAMGDESGYQVCLRADRGFTSALHFSAGATTFETSMTAK